jgi:Bacteriophage head to tail connecting protein
MARVRSVAGQRGPTQRTGPQDDPVGVITDYARRLRDNRQTNWDSLFDECAKYFLPERRDFITKETPGQERMDELFISTPIIARRALGTTVSSMLRPANRQWFQARMDDERLNQVSEIRQWLDAVTQTTFANLYDPRARFEEQAAEVDNDLVTFGSGILYFGLNRGQGHFVFEAVSLSEACFAENEMGHIDQMYRFRTMPLRNVVSTFGMDKLTPRLKDKASASKPDWEEPFEILHAVLPNAEFERFGFRANNLPFQSVWIETQEKKALERSGYFTFPYATPRWDVLSGEVYGRSPAMTALPDARVANAIAQTLLDAGQKAVSPPMTAPTDMIRGEVELFAGGLTLFDGAGFQYQGPPIRPVELGKNIPLGVEILQAYEERIYAAFYRDILMLPNRPDMTAEEVRRRTDEFVRQAAPVFARVETDYNAAVVHRAFNVLEREGAFPKRPDDIVNRKVQFIYESQVKQVRDKARALNTIDALNSIIQLAVVNKDIIDNVNWDMASRMLMRDLGAPEAVLATEAQLEAIRQQRQQQEAAAQALIAAQQAGVAGQEVADAEGKMRMLQQGQNPAAKGAPGPAAA